jgi:thiol-disulfide isomerase/thioredoxin
VLVFWAGWCRPCRLEITRLERLRPGDPVYLVDELISELEPASVQAEVAHLRLRHPVLYDRWGEVGDALAVRGLPTLIRFDRQGLPSARVLGVLSERALARLLAPE